MAPEGVGARTSIGQTGDFMGEKLKISEEHITVKWPPTLPSVEIALVGFSLRRAFGLRAISTACVEIVSSCTRVSKPRRVLMTTLMGAN